MTSHHSPLTSSLSSKVLRALFELAQADVPCDAGIVARLLGVGAREVAESLVELDTRGLVCAERARLTLLGLAHAVRLAPLALALPIRASAPPPAPARARLRAAQRRRAPGGRREDHHGTARLAL